MVSSKTSTLTTFPIKMLSTLHSYVLKEVQDQCFNNLIFKVTPDSQVDVLAKVDVKKYVSCTRELQIIVFYTYAPVKI